MKIVSWTEGAMCTQSNKYFKGKLYCGDCVVLGLRFRTDSQIFVFLSDELENVLFQALPVECQVDIEDGMYDLL